MRADEIAQNLPCVALDEDVVTTAHVVATGDLPGVVVAGADGRPRGLLPACDLLASVVPGFVRESPCLARVYDEEHADNIARGMMLGRRVREILTDGRYVVVKGEATVMELATAMTLSRSPLVAVRMADGGWRVVTANRLLAHLLPTS